MNSVLRRLLAPLVCLAVSVPASASCLPAPSGLVGFWTGDGVGTDAVSGTEAGLYFGATYTPAVVGHGFWMPGGGTNLVYAETIASQQVTTGITVEGWIYFEPIEVFPGQYSLANATIGAGGAIEQGSVAWQFVIRIPNPTQHSGDVAANPLAYRELVFAVRRTDGTVAQVSKTFPQASPEWTHVAATYDDSGLASLHVNGGVIDVEANGTGTTASAAGDNIAFGVLPFPDNYQQQFHGVIDEISLYDRQLADAQIEAVVAAWTAGKCRPGQGGMTCHTANFVTACATTWTEGPPGFYLASGDIGIGPVPDAPYFVVRNGEVKVGPSAGSLSYKGTLVAPTPLGDVPLYSTQGSSRWQVTTDGEWAPNESNGTFTRLLEGLPAFSQLGLDLNNFPFASVPPGAIRIDLGNGCIFGEPSYSLTGLPESGAFSAAGWFSVCADNLSIQGGIDDMDVTVAGANLHLKDAYLTQSGNDLAFYADQVNLTLPLEGGAARANARGVYVSADDVHVDGGSLALPPLNLGPFKIGYANAALHRRSDNSYRICGGAGFEFPQIAVGASIDFAMTGGELQYGCVSGTFPPVAVIPGLPVYVDRLGGCVQLPTSSPIYDGELCTPGLLHSASGCLTGDCDLGLPSVGLTTRVLAGTPGELGGGYLLTADPVTLSFGPNGFRAGADVHALGNYFGTGEICVANWGAEMCAHVDIGHAGAIVGDAHLWIDDQGIEGTFGACVNFTQKCIGPYCWNEPSSYSAQVGLGKFDAGWRKRYGFWADVSACQGCFGGGGGCPFSLTVAFDLRTGEFFWSGVKPLPRGSGFLAKGAVEAGIREFGPFIVDAGATQVLFVVDSDGAPLDVTVVGPDGEVADGAEDVVVEKKEPEGLTIFALNDPPAGSWTIRATGVPEGALVEADAFVTVDAATVQVTEPASDTDVAHVAWNATIPATAETTTLSILAAATEELAQAGGGILVHEQELAAGAGSVDLPPWALPAGTWSLVVKLDDGMGHVSRTVAPGKLIVLDAEAPEPPASAEALSLPGGARVRWTASPSPDVARYEVLSRAPLDELDVVTIAAGSELSLDVTGLEAGEQRLFLVRAVDASGNVSATVEAGIAGADAAADAEPPPAPTLEVVALGPGSLRATWTAPTDAVEYRVRYGITADLVGGLADEGASPLASTGTTIDLTGFEPGAKIFVGVQALDAAGNVSETSNVEGALLTDGADTDGDGLPDDWETLWMLSLEAQGDADTDGDFLTDAEELDLGFDPAFVSPFVWGDLAPAGAFDGAVDISDVVRALRLSLAVEEGDADVRRRAEVAPAQVQEGGILRPTRDVPMRMSIADVVLILRAAVGLAELDEPFPQAP